MNNQLSNNNMFALLMNGKIENKIALPAGLTFSQVLEWLENKGFINEYWSFDGIYEYK